MNNAACVGWIFGMLYGGAVGLILYEMRQAQLKMGHSDRALDKFPDSAQPDLTARKLMSTARQARLMYILYIVVLILVLVSCPALFFLIVLPAVS